MRIEEGCSVIYELVASFKAEKRKVNVDDTWFWVSPLFLSLSWSSGLRTVACLLLIWHRCREICLLYCFSLLIGSDWVFFVFHREGNGLAEKLLFIILFFDKFKRHFAMRWSYAQKPLFSILKIARFSSFACICVCVYVCVCYSFFLIVYQMYSCVSGFFFRARRFVRFPFLLFLSWFSAVVTHSMDPSRAYTWTCSPMWEYITKPGDVLPVARSSDPFVVLTFSTNWVEIHEHQTAPPWNLIVFRPYHSYIWFSWFKNCKQYLFLHLWG